VLYRTAAAQRPLLVLGQEAISERIERPCAYNLHRARQIIAPAIFIATLRFLGIAAFTSPKPRNSTMMMELASDVASVLAALPKLESRDDHHFFPERGMERTISDRRQHRTSTASQRLSNRVVYRSAIVGAFSDPRAGGSTSRSQVASIDAQTLNDAFVVGPLNTLFIIKYRFYFIFFINS
jgi:hypothetical protein